MNRTGALGIEHHMFAELCDLLPEGALLVANNSRVLPARLRGLRATGGKVEFLLLTPLPVVVEAAGQGSGRHEAPAGGLLRAGGRLKPGEEGAGSAHFCLFLLKVCRSETGRLSSMPVFTGIDEDSSKNNFA